MASESEVRDIAKNNSALSRELLDSIASIGFDFSMGRSFFADEKWQESFSLNDFEKLNTIGTGTFGKVLVVKRKASGEYFALKVLPIIDIIRQKQVYHVKNEKHILRMITHPFIVNLKWTDHDSRFLYMLFEYVCGGELFTYLRNQGSFSEFTSRFYASEIVLALEFMHSQDIVYRDLKPENLLLDRRGHIKITDFGFAKKVEDRTWTICGTPEYLAPEIIQSKGHNKSVDWWSFGVLIYEMLAGYSPFADSEQFGIYEKILLGHITWPRSFPPVAKELVSNLLMHDRTKRLGNLKNGTDDVKHHKWFAGIDWDKTYSRELIPPIMPDVLDEGDTSNFDIFPDVDFNATQPAPSSIVDFFANF